MELPDFLKTNIDSRSPEMQRTGPQQMLDVLKTDVETVRTIGEARSIFESLKVPAPYEQNSALAAETNRLKAAFDGAKEKPTVELATPLRNRVKTLQAAIAAAEKMPTLEEQLKVIEQNLSIAATPPFVHRQALEKIKTTLADPDGELTSVKTGYEQLAPLIAPLHAFAVEVAKYPQNKELTQPFVDRVLKDNADPAAELTALQTKMGAVIEDQQNTAEDASIPEEPTLAERLQNWVDGMGEDSKFKAPMAKLVGAVSAIGIALAKLPFFGDKVRGVLVSNEVLAKNGDKTAAKAVKAEGHLKKFGLPKALANSECLVPVKKFTDAVAKGADTMDAARAAQLRQLAGQLTAYTNSHTSSVAEKTTVLDILAAPDFKPRYKAASAAAADTPPTDNAPVPTPPATAEEKKAPAKQAAAATNTPPPGPVTAPAGSIKTS